MRLRDTQTFFNCYRMMPATFDKLLALIAPIITRVDTTYRKCVSAKERLAITLRYLATGTSQFDISVRFQVGHSTANGIIMETCMALWDVLSSVYLKIPSTAEERETVASQFGNTWNFPHCLGAIDGKHVAIQAPKNSGSSYYNYKGFHSIVLLAACDAHYRFIAVDIGCQGRFSDGGIFSTSQFGKFLANSSLGVPPPSPIPGTGPMPYFFVADEAFPLKSYLMRPFPGRDLGDVGRRVYNYRVSRARRTIENVFGILVARWRIMRSSIVAQPEQADKIVKACCVLHNFLKSEEIGSMNYCPPTLVDRYDSTGRLIPGEWRNEGNTSGLSRLGWCRANNFQDSAAHIRETLVTYFMSPSGGVPWQYDLNRV